MCECPSTIFNRKIKAATFIHGVDRSVLTVPCGNCAACRSRKVDDLVFRGYYEYLDTVRRGGFVLFQTLTYSERHVPYYQGMRFFRKSDVQKFLKRLRKRLERSGYYVDGLLKYLVTFEYGTDPNKTHRPHYHVLFFCNVRDVAGVPIHPDEFDRHVTLSWSLLDKKLPPDVGRSSLGRLDPADTEKRIVNSIYGIRYVAKYVAKGANVAEAVRYSSVANSSLYQFVEAYCQDHDIDIATLDDFQLSKIWKLYLLDHPDFPDDMQLFPTVMQSHNVGIDFLNWFGDTGSFEDIFDVVNIDDFSPKGFRSYQVPLYYIRKVFYDYHPDTRRFTLNELGAQYYMNKNDKLYKETMELMVNTSKLLDEVTSVVVSGYDSFQYLCIDKLCGSSVSDFVKWSVFLRGKEINPALLMLDLEKIDIDTLCTMQEELDIDCYIHDSSYFTCKRYSNLFHDYIISDYKFGELQYYDQMDRFSHFVELWDYVSKIKMKFANALSKKIGEEMKKDIDLRAAMVELKGINQSIVF